MAETAIYPTSFFKVLFGDFQDQLLLPTEFTKKYHGVVPKKFILRSPTGVAWMVSVKEVENNFFLCKEWMAFVRDHALEAGQFLVFHCNSISDFSVQIFCTNECRKEVHVATAKNENMGAQGDELTRDKSATTGTLPSFTITYGPSRLYKLIVPRAFAKRYMKKVAESVTLRVSDGSVWRTRCGVGVHHGLVGGWKSFVVDNGLKDGDVCTFELVERDPIELKVSIVR
ncbi:hypothetical protein ACHQM5_026891 [Ranunculus cassubicifolius]